MKLKFEIYVYGFIVKTLFIVLSIWFGFELYRLYRLGNLDVLILISMWGIIPITWRIIMIPIQIESSVLKHAMALAFFNSPLELIANPMTKRESLWLGSALAATEIVTIIILLYVMYLVWKEEKPKWEEEEKKKKWWLDWYNNWTDNPYWLWDSSIN